MLVKHPLFVVIAFMFCIWPWVVSAEETIGSSDSAGTSVNDAKVASDPEVDDPVPSELESRDASIKSNAEERDVSQDEQSADSNGDLNSEQVQQESATTPSEAEAPELPPAPAAMPSTKPEVGSSSKPATSAVTNIDARMYAVSQKLALAGLLTWSAGIVVKATSSILNYALIRSSNHVSATDKALVFSSAYVLGPTLDLTGGFLSMAGERMAKRANGYSSAWALKDSRTRLSAGQVLALSFIPYPKLISGFTVASPYNFDKFEKNDLGALFFLILGVGRLGYPQVMRGIATIGGFVRIRRFAQKHNIVLQSAPIINAQYLGWGVQGSF